MTLSEKANDIIMQPAHTDDDILELSKIAWQMWLLYWKSAAIAWEQEANYNQTRATSYEEHRKDSTQWDAERKAKLDAEVLYWDFRTLKGKVTQMKSFIERIDKVCIAYYFKAKAERSASMTTQ